MFVFMGKNYLTVDKLGNKIKKLYDIKGSLLLETEADIIYPLNDDSKYFMVSESGKYQLFDPIHKKYVPGESFIYSDGMIKISNDEKYYFINEETGKKIGENYQYAYDFHEGIASIRPLSSTYKYFIDKTGKVILRESEQLSFSDESSEGVIAARVNYKNSYIYNPLGSQGYKYNQTAFSDATIDMWITKAHEAFEKKQFATAKDYYYKVMMNKPDNSDAICNYGACLNNLGHYDEAIEAFQMAVDIDPSSELAKKNLETAIANRRKTAERQVEEEEQEDNNTNMFWDALSNFAKK